MASIVSSKLVDGESAVYSTFNNLREDLLSNHDHSSGKGGAIDHAILTESAAMAGRICDHGDIDTHIAHGLAAANDNPGYNQGVHGLNSSVYVAGSLGSALVVKAGTATLDTMIEAVQGIGLYGKRITGLGFTTLVAVTATFINKPDYAYDDASPSERNYVQGLYIRGASASEFTVVAADTEEFWNGGHDRQVYWIAIGTVAK